MTGNIKPKFDTFDVITVWDEGSNRWAKELAVFILNGEEEVGEQFYITVCSPEFLNSPNDEVAPEDMKKAIILDNYSQDEVEAKLSSKIDSIGEVSLSEFEAKMKNMFNMSDWYGTEEQS